MGTSSGSHRLLLALPVTLLLEGVGDLAWHVGLVVLGKHRVGLEHAGPVEHAFGEHALPGSEEGKPALLAGHGLRSSEESARSPASASMPAIAVWSGANAARAF